MKEVKGRRAVAERYPRSNRLAHAAQPLPDLRRQRELRAARRETRCRARPVETSMMRCFGEQRCSVAAARRLLKNAKIAPYAPAARRRNAVDAAERRSTMGV